MLSLRRSFLLLAVAILCIDSCHSATMARAFESRLGDDVIMAPKKRPFCNAFTGCGRKRSQYAPGMPAQDLRPKQYVDDDTFGALVESEGAVDELSRQILSEAKLWETIQEASAEIARRKQRESYNF